MRRIVAGLLAVLLATGCATTTRTETRRVYTEAKTVVVGDQVRVTTRDGARFDFRVTAVDDKKVQGKNVSVARADIASIKTLGTTTVRTEEVSAQPAATAISTALIVGGIVAIVAINSWDGDD